jgi:hypothetical protein
MCWFTFGPRVVLGMDMLSIGFESDSCILGLLYNKGAPHIVTYNDLIAIGAQGEPTAWRPVLRYHGEDRL